MTKRDFALLAVRLLGLYVIATSFDSLIWLSSVISGPSSTMPAWQRWMFALAPFGFQVAFGLFLWMFAGALAYLMTGEGAASETISRWQPREVTRIGLVLLGILSLLHGISLAGQSFGRFAIFGGGTTTPLGILSLFVAPAMPLAFGLILLCGARFFSFWLAPRDAYPPAQSSDWRQPSGDSHDQT